MVLQYVPKSEFPRILNSGLSKDKLISIFSNVCRLNTLYMIKRAGSGHIGSSFSAMDLVSTLFLDELNISLESQRIYDGDIYFSSKGHDAPGLYSVMAALGMIPYDQIHHLRRITGLPGHPDVSTLGIPTNTGSLGMGISKAKGFLRYKRACSKKGRVFVLLGDGELQEGQIWESLHSAVNHQYSDLFVIVDHNKVQSDYLVSDVSDLGNLTEKFSAFGFAVARCDGHRVDDIKRGLEDLKKSTQKPKVLIADTIKGQGVSFMRHVEDLKRNKYYQYHSGAPSDSDYIRATKELVDQINSELNKLDLKLLQTDEISYESAASPVPQKQSLVAAYSRALLENAKQNSNLIALDADLVKDTGLIPLMENLPQQFLECGIAEQDMVSQAGALALSGMLPVVHSFACFVVPRANEQIYNNASEKTKIIYSGFLAGLLPAGPGHSHQSIRDIALMGCVPNLIMLQPATEKQVQQAVDFAVKENTQSTYLRISNFQIQVPFTEEEVLVLGRGQVVHPGDDVLLVTYGPVLLAEAYHAAQAMNTRGKSVRVVNMPWLNRIDITWFERELTAIRHLIILDDHLISGGLGDFFAGQILENGLGNKLESFCRLGLNEVPVCGLPAEVLKYHGLDSVSIQGHITRILT